MSFDHTTWIDQQRAAGSARGNIFADIVSAAARHREAKGIRSDVAYGRRTARVREIRADTARFDATITPIKVQDKLMTFPEWQALQDTQANPA
jgi:hypothetical protein